jgi:hypothetical protein
MRFFVSQPGALYVLIPFRSIKNELAYSTSVLHSNTWKLSGQYAQPHLVGPPPQGIATLHLPSSPLSAIRVRWSLQRACNSTTLLCDRPSCQITCHCTCVHTVLLNPDKNRKRSVIGAALTVLLQQPSHQLTTAHTTFWASQGKDHGSSHTPLYRELHPNAEASEPSFGQSHRFFFFLFYVLAGTCHSKIKNISKLDGFFLIFFLARLGTNCFGG